MRDFEPDPFEFRTCLESFRVLERSLLHKRHEETPFHPWCSGGFFCTAREQQGYKQIKQNQKNIYNWERQTTTSDLSGSLPCLPDRWRNFQKNFFFLKKLKNLSRSSSAVKVRLGGFSFCLKLKKNESKINLLRFFTFVSAIGSCGDVATRSPLTSESRWLPLSFKCVRLCHFCQKKAKFQWGWLLCFVLKIDGVSIIYSQSHDLYLILFFFFNWLHILVSASFFFF